MISTRKELKEWLKYEKSLYRLSRFDIISKSPMYYNWKYVKLLRHSEYYRNSKKKILMPFFFISRLRKNLLGKKINVEIGDNCCDKGLLIYHSGSIVINGHSKIGKNLKLHGCNCVGNLGDEDLRCPIIGDNVEFGVGAIAIGNIKIGNNIKIGANATCVKSCEEDGITLVGTPAQKINKK